MTKKKKPELKFDKWKDPYGDNIEDVEWPGFQLSAKKPKTAYTDSYSDLEQKDLEIEEELAASMPPPRPLKFLATSFGHIPLTEDTNPSKIFNFWVGHTNFDITNDIFDVIEETDGVEILDIFTRYRFRIGIGKMFKDGDVMRDIRKAVYKHVKTTT